MNVFKLLALTTLTLFYTGCKDETPVAEDLFEITIKNLKKTYTTSDAITASVINKKNLKIDSVVYYLNKDKINAVNTLAETTVSLTKQKLGERTLLAKIYTEGNKYDVATKITIVSSIVPKLYTYKIIEEYPHDIKAYTQGLEFANEVLYESTGQYKESSLRKTNYKTGEVEKKVLLGNTYFGEGLTIINNKIYQLTWKENVGLIYDLETMQKKGSFVYSKSKEGWGLCNNGKTIFKSDGTQKIWSLNANTLGEESYIELYTNTSKIKSVNELEWVEGKIYANIYQKNAIAIVNPANGAVEGVIDFTDLKSHVTQHKTLDVLNGIAYKGEPNILYITGKNWDKLFKVEILEK